MAAEAYLKLLAEGQLERCLGAYWAAAGAAGVPPQASAGDGRGLSLGVALPLHRLAAYLFGTADDAAAPLVEQAQRLALLRTAVRRCSSNAGKRQLLGMLLRWDAAAGAPSDMVPAGRMVALEVACSTDSEGGELLAAVRAALED